MLLCREQRLETFIKNGTIELESDTDIYQFNYDFKPISDQYSHFCGTFDGNEHKINLELDRQFDDYIGFFGWKRDATIINLTVCGCIRGHDKVAAFVVHVEDTSLLGCKNFADVTGNFCIGDFVCVGLGNTKIYDCEGFALAISNYDQPKYYTQND